MSNRFGRLPRPVPLLWTRDFGPHGCLLLVSTTLVIAYLIPGISRGSQHEDASIAAIKALGGQVTKISLLSDPATHFGVTFEARTMTQAHVEAIDGLDRVTDIYLFSTKETDWFLRNVGNPARLRTLLIQSTDLTSSGFSELPRFKNLVALSLKALDVTADDLGSIGRLTSLKSLNLAKSNLSGEGFVRLKTLDKLTVLLLNDTGIGDDAMVHLSSFPHLRSLDLRNTKVTDAGVPHLVELPSLRELLISGITDVGMKQICSIKSLTRLSVYDSRITEQSFRFIEDATNIRNLSLVNNPLLTKEAFERFTKTGRPISIDSDLWDRP